MHTFTKARIAKLEAKIAAKEVEVQRLRKELVKANCRNVPLDFNLNQYYNQNYPWEHTIHKTNLQFVQDLGNPFGPRI